MRNNKSQKLFGFTLLVVVGFFFIWTGGPSTFNAVMDSVASSGEYKASMPPTSDLIVHGGLLAVTIYIAMTVIGEKTKHTDKVPEGEISINYFNLIPISKIPQHLLSTEEKEKGKQNLEEEEDENPQLFTRPGKGIDNNMKSLSKILQSMGSSKDLTERSIFDKTKEKQFLRDRLQKYDKLMDPPPYPEQDLISADIKLAHMNKLNLRVLEDGIVPITYRDKKEQITSKLKDKVSESTETSNGESSTDKPTDTKPSSIGKKMKSPILLNKEKINDQPKNKLFNSNKGIGDMIKKAVKNNPNKKENKPPQKEDDIKEKYNDRPVVSASNHFKP